MLLSELVHKCHKDKIVRLSFYKSYQKYELIL